MAYEETYRHLTAHGIKPSVQRIAVMEYLLENRTHPTVEDIYGNLVQRIPTLSKTTVYNTLRRLAGQGAIRMLTIDERQTCFDGFTHPHAHFLCTTCGRVYDVPLTGSDTTAICHVPDGFAVDTTDLYLRGQCAICRSAGNGKRLD